MLSIIWNILSFIVTLGVLITIHEFGHFLMARVCGVHVERFSIGFGKTLLKYTDRQGTDFIIALIPIGGYVKMLDEHLECITPKIRYYAFSNKKISQRAAIIAAGPIANLIFSVFAYWLVFIVGTHGIRPIIDEIIPNSIAEKAQLKSGMELKAINGIKTLDWDSAKLGLATKIGDNSVTISIVSPNSNKWQDKVLDLRYWNFEPNEEDIVTSLGIRPINTKIEPILVEVKSGSAASKAGLQIGDKIVKVNGQPIMQWITFIKIVRDNPGKLLKLEIKRQNNLLFLNLVPDKKFFGFTLKGFAGVVPKIIPLSNEYKILHQYEPFSAFLKANDKTWQLVKLTTKTLIELTIGNFKLKNLNGPILIAQGAGVSAKSGITNYIMFLALISVNIGIVNLFPLPILDGGRLLFLIFEKFSSGLISEQIQEFSYRISSILLMLLIGIAIFNDLSRL